MKVKIKKKISPFKDKFSLGFGLVDSIISISLLGIVVSYSIYFATKRMNLLFTSNINRSINKEIKRDIDLLRTDMWSMGLDASLKKYSMTDNSCINISTKILELPNWAINESRPNPNSPRAPLLNSANIQYWWPNVERGKIFKGRGILIVRELSIKSFNENNNLDQNISNINYRVIWEDNNIHWISIDLGLEAHSWCF